MRLIFAELRMAVMLGKLEAVVHPQHGHVPEMVIVMQLAALKVLEVALHARLAHLLPRLERSDMVETGGRRIRQEEEADTMVEEAAWTAEEQLEDRAIRMESEHLITRDITPATAT